MKKSMRILSLLLAIVLTMSTMSVMGSAYTNYKYTGTSQTTDAVMNFDDADQVVLTTAQCATLALDQVDALLAESISEPIDLLGMATLKLYSVDEAISSVSGLVGQLGSALDLLGDAADLKETLNNLAGINRSMNPTDNPWAVANNNVDDADTESDLLVLYTVLDLLGDANLGGIVEKYIDGSLSVGILNSMISSYKFDLENLAFSALIKVAELGDEYDENGERTKKWDIIDDINNIASIPNGHGAAYLEDGTADNGYESGALLLANDVLVKFVLGDWVKLQVTDDDSYEGAVYDADHTYRKVVWDEYYWIDGTTGEPTGETEPDWDNYDYYGYVHPDAWVTFGLGDAIRVAKGATAPEASYDAINLAKAKAKIKAGQMTGYDFIENLVIQAFNGVAVPVLNRLVVSWLREEAGYEFLDSKTEEYQKNSDGSYVLDADGEKIINKEYDYCYIGEDNLKEGKTTSNMIALFNTSNGSDRIKIGRYDPDDYSGDTFVMNLNDILGNAVGNIINQDVTYNSSTKTWTLVRKLSDTESRNCTLTWKTGKAKNGNLFENACSLVRFALMYTDDIDFFSSDTIDRGEVHTYQWVVDNYNDANGTDAAVAKLADQKLVGYILRAIINSSVDYMYIEPDDNETLATVAYHIAEQFAAQSVPHITYTMPSASSYQTTEAYNEALLNKALIMLVDVAAYSLNQSMDTNIDDTASDTHITNNGTVNQTGLLAYLGDSATSISATGNALAKWALKNYAPILSLYDMDDYEDSSKAEFWTVLDNVINNIIPLYTTTKATGWLDEDIYTGKEKDTFLEEVLINYILLPVLNLDDTGKIFDLLEKGDATAFSGNQDFETIIVKVLNLIFDDLFPNVFDSNTMKDLDTVINKANLSSFLKRLLASLGAHSKFTGADGQETTGRGKAILAVGLPIAGMILGITGAQEFKELENYIPEVITTSTTKQYNINNASEGLNTSYLGNGSSTRTIDALYTYRFNNGGSETYTPQIVDVTGGGKQTPSITGFNVSTLAAGSMASYSINGLETGHVYSITFKYDVLNEKGQKLGDTMENTAYTYVSPNADSEGNVEDTTKKTVAFDSDVITYTSDYYVTGGISGITGYTYSYKSKGSRTEAKVTSVVLKDPSGNVVPGIGMDNLQDSEGNANGKVWQQGLTSGGTYTLMPFTYDDETYAYKRQAYNYEETTTGEGDDAVTEVVTDHGLNVVKSKKTASDYTDEKKTVVILDNGTYTLQAVINGVTITSYIHLYDEYGLEGMLNNAIEKNYTADSFADDSDVSFSDYSNRLKRVAGFILADKAQGTSFSTAIDTTLTGYQTYGPNNRAYENKYQQYYAYLYDVINGIKLKSEGASALKSRLAEMINVSEYETRTIKVSNTESYTVPMLKSKDYDDSSYKYIGQLNYTGYAYSFFRDARDLAEDVIAKDQACNGVDFNITQEQFDAANDKDKANYIAKMKAWTEWEGKGTVTSSELNYATYKLNLAWERLQGYKVNYGDSLKTRLNSYVNSSKYNLTETALADYTSSSSAAYSKALTFAKSTNTSSAATPDQVVSALNELIECYKDLRYGCNTEALKELVETVSTGSKSVTYSVYNEDEEEYDETTGNVKYINTAYIKGTLTGGYTFVSVGDEYNDKIGLTVKFSKESYAAFVEAFKAAYEAYNKDWLADEQSEVNAIVANLNAAIAGLEGYIVEGEGGGDEPGGDEPGEEGEYSYELIFDIDPDEWSEEQYEYFIDGEVAYYDEENEIYGFTVNGTQTWVPAVDKQTAANYVYDMFEIELDNESEDEDSHFTIYHGEDEEPVDIDGLLVGLPDSADSEMIGMIFANVENCSIVIEETEKGCGTGTIIYIMDENEEEILETYLVVYRSDVNGDGSCTPDDITETKKAMAGFFDWESVDQIYKYIAADVDSNESLEADDISALKWHLAGSEGNGVNWEDIWQPAGNGEYMGQYPFLEE